MPLLSLRNQNFKKKVFLGRKRGTSYLVSLFTTNKKAEIKQRKINVGL